MNTDGFTSQFGPRHAAGSHFGRDTYATLSSAGGSFDYRFLPRGQSSKQYGAIAARSGESRGIVELLRSVNVPDTAEMAISEYTPSLYTQKKW